MSDRILEEQMRSETRSLRAKIDIQQALIVSMEVSEKGLREKIAHLDISRCVWIATTLVSWAISISLVWFVGHVAHEGALAVSPAGQKCDASTERAKLTDGISSGRKRNWLCVKGAWREVGDKVFREVLEGSYEPVDE